MSDDLSKTQMIKAYLSNGSRPSLGNILTILGMLGGLFTVWGTLSADNADTKRRVSTVEERQREDRTEVKDRLQRIEEKAASTDKNVIEIKTILQQMERSRR